MTSVSVSEPAEHLPAGQLGSTVQEFFSRAWPRYRLPNRAQHDVQDLLAHQPGLQARTDR